MTEDISTGAGHTALKPCPFCGGEAQPALVQAGGIEWAQVECVERGCCASGPTPATEAEAIAAWNTRHREQSQAELLEALEKAATRFDHCASMIEQGFNISGTLRAEHRMKAQAYAYEARAAINRTKGTTA